MKTRLTLTAIAILALVALTAPASAQTYGHRVGGFLDENGDGFNDLAPDADGDGIPNGLDPDYAPPADGSGYQFGPGDGGQCPEVGFIYRFWYKWQYMWQRLTGGPNGYGPGDGTGNGGTGPADGTGYGPGGDGCVPRFGARTH